MSDRRDCEAAGVGGPSAAANQAHERAIKKARQKVQREVMEAEKAVAEANRRKERLALLRERLGTGKGEPKPGAMEPTNPLIRPNPKVRRAARRDLFAKEFARQLPMAQRAVASKARWPENEELAAIFVRFFFEGYVLGAGQLEDGSWLDDFRYLCRTDKGWLTFRNVPGFTGGKRRPCCEKIGSTKALAGFIAGENRNGRLLPHIGYPIRPNVSPEAAARFLHVDIDFTKAGAPLAEIQPDISLLEGLGFLVLPSSPRVVAGVEITNGLHAWCFLTEPVPAEALRRIVAKIDGMLIGRIDKSNAGPWKSQASLPLPVARWKNNPEPIFRERLTNFFIGREFEIPFQCLADAVGLPEPVADAEPNGSAAPWPEPPPAAPAVPQVEGLGNQIGVQLETEEAGSVGLADFSASLRAMLADFLAQRRKMKGKDKANSVGISVMELDLSDSADSNLRNRLGDSDLLSLGCRRSLFPDEMELGIFLTNNPKSIPDEFCPIVPNGEFTRMVIETGLWRFIGTDEVIARITAPGGDVTGRVKQWRSTTEWSNQGGGQGTRIFNSQFLAAVHRWALELTLPPGNRSSLSLAEKQLFTGKALAHWLFTTSGQMGPVFLTYRAWAEAVGFTGEPKSFQRQFVYPLIDAGLIVEAGRAYVSSYNDRAAQQSIQWEIGELAQPLMDLIPPPPVLRQMEWTEHRSAKLVVCGGRARTETSADGCILVDNKAAGAPGIVGLAA